MTKDLSAIKAKWEREKRDDWGDMLKEVRLAERMRVIEEMIEKLNRTRPLPECELLKKLQAMTERDDVK